LRTLLIAMTLVAIWCMLVVALPAAFSQFIVGCLWILAGSWIVAGIFYGTGDARAFCLGAAVALSSLWTGFGGQMMQGSRSVFGLFIGGRLPQPPISLWLDLLVISAVAIGSGLVCQRARRYFEE